MLGCCAGYSCLILILDYEYHSDIELFLDDTHPDAKDGGLLVHVFEINIDVEAMIIYYGIVLALGEGFELDGFVQIAEAHEFLHRLAVDFLLDNLFEIPVDLMLPQLSFSRAGQFPKILLNVERFS